MEKFDAFVQKLSKSRMFICLEFVQKSVLVAAGAAVFVLTIVTVFLRYVLKINVMGLDEIILVVIFWMYFFGAAQGSKDDSQIKADMIGTILKNKKIIAVCHLIARIVECTVIVICIKWSIDYLLKDAAIMPYTVVLAIPLIVSHMAMFFGFILMMIYHLYWLMAEAAGIVHVMRREETA